MKALETIKKIKRYKKKLDVFQKNQYKIACDTLKMSDIGASIMGGMTKREAKIIKARLEKKMKERK